MENNSIFLLIQINLFLLFDPFKQMNMLAHLRENCSSLGNTLLKMTSCVRLYILGDKGWQE